MNETCLQDIPRGRWLRIIPPMIIIYVISYMDRMNISYAIAGGMNEALGISMTLSGIAAGIFFIGYMFLQVPGGNIAEHGKAKNFILCSILAWGGLSLATAYVQNEWQLLTVRFLLGLAEGGLWPAILVILSNWFPKKEIGRANALFMSSMAIAQVITSPLSAWLIEVYSWRGMFIVEGVLSLVMVFFWYPLIFDRPQDAKWISKEEKEFLVDTISKEKGEVQGQVKPKVSYKKLMSDINLWKLTLIYFSFAAGRLGFMIWLPTIIKNITKMGITSVGMLTAGPYIMAIVGMYLFSALSDKSLNRRMYTIIPAVSFGLCFWLSTQFSDQVWLSYCLLLITGLFVMSFIPVFWTMPPLLFASGSSGAARGFINALGGLGAFVGPSIFGWFASKFGISYGIYCLVFFMFLGAGTCLTLPSITGGTRETTGSVNDEIKG